MRLSERTAVLHHTLRSSLAPIVTDDYLFGRFIFRTFFELTVFKHCSREIAVATIFGKIHISAHENG
jgi:hypothetical protein